MKAIITIRRIGTTEQVYREIYECDTQQQAENRASSVWSRPEYASNPGLFRLKLHVDKQLVMTID